MDGRHGARRRRHGADPVYGKARGDIALAMLFYGGIAGGVMIIYLAPNGSNANLTSYLFGSLISVSPQDFTRLCAGRRSCCSWPSGCGGSCSPSARTRSSPGSAGCRCARSFPARGDRGGHRHRGDEGGGPAAGQRADGDPGGHRPTGDAVVRLDAGAVGGGGCATGGAVRHGARTTSTCRPAPAWCSPRWRSSWASRRWPRWPEDAPGGPRPEKKAAPGSGPARRPPVGIRLSPLGLAQWGASGQVREATDEATDKEAPVTTTKHPVCVAVRPGSAPRWPPPWNEVDEFRSADLHDILKLRGDSVGLTTVYAPSSLADAGEMAVHRRRRVRLPPVLRWRPPPPSGLPCLRQDRRGRGPRGRRMGRDGRHRARLRRCRAHDGDLRRGA